MSKKYLNLKVLLKSICYSLCISFKFTWRMPCFCVLTQGSRFAESWILESCKYIPKKSFLNIVVPFFIMLLIKTTIVILRSRVRNLFYNETRCMAVGRMSDWERRRGRKRRRGGRQGENWTFNPVGALGKYLPLDVFIVLITPGIAADLSWSCKILNIDFCDWSRTEEAKGESSLSGSLNNRSRFIMDWASMLMEVWIIAVTAQSLWRKKLCTDLSTVSCLLTLIFFVHPQFPICRFFSRHIILDNS